MLERRSLYLSHPGMSVHPIFKGLRRLSCIPNTENDKYAIPTSLSMGIMCTNYPVLASVGNGATSTFVAPGAGCTFFRYISSLSIVCLEKD